MLARILFFLRDLRSQRLFEELKKVVRGHVLDVGGGDFFYRLPNGVKFSRWTCLEIDPQKVTVSKDPRFEIVIGDGCCLPFASSSFDVALNLQVLEHVFEPLKMLQEIFRVLKPGGAAVFLIPQTSNLHGIPHHYYNFTRFWILKAMTQVGFQITLLEPLGGFWSSMASRFFYFYFHALGFPPMRLPNVKRSLNFYFLFPLMALVAAVGIPVCLLLSLGDLVEEPNNHLVVVKKEIT